MCMHINRLYQDCQTIYLYMHTKVYCIDAILDSLQYIAVSYDSNKSEWYLLPVIDRCVINLGMKGPKMVTMNSCD